MSNVKAKQNQSRVFSLTTYVSLELIQSVIDSHKNQIRNFAYILHDKDTGKEPHYHIALYLFYPYHLQTVINWFEDKVNGQNTLGQVMRSRHAIYNYFSHKDEPSKAQYNESDIVCGDPVDWVVPDRPEDNAFMGLDMMLTGIPLRDICKELGRDFIYHYSHIKKIYDDIRRQENGGNI